jgi:phage terminase small subunit
MNTDKDTSNEITLTKRQMNFVIHYFSCGFNARRAAELAGYNPGIALNMGLVLLKNPAVRCAIHNQIITL